MFSLTGLILISQVLNKTVVFNWLAWLDMFQACQMYIEATANSRWCPGCSGLIPVKAPSGLIHWIKISHAEDNCKIPYNFKCNEHSGLKFFPHLGNNVKKHGKLEPKLIYQWFLTDGTIGSCKGGLRTSIAYRTVE